MKDRFFVYCNESGFELFETLDDALDAANERIQGYLDDAWSDEVTSVCAGKITHRAKMCDQVFPDGEIDEDSIDEAGDYWDPDWEYKCNYKMLPVKKQSPDHLADAGKMIVHGHSARELFMCAAVMHDLAASDMKDLSDGDIEIIFEDEEGREGSFEVSIAEYAAKTAAILESVKSAPVMQHQTAANILPVAFVEWLEAFIAISDSAGIDDHEKCWTWPALLSDTSFFDSYPQLTTGVMRELHKCLSRTPEKPADAPAVEQKPYAYEYGLDNGDGTFSVVINKGRFAQLKENKFGYLPPFDTASKEHPVTPLYLHPQPAPEASGLVEALEVVKTVLESDDPAIADTIWVPDHVSRSETLYEHICSALAAYRAQGGDV